MNAYDLSDREVYFFLSHLHLFGSQTIKKIRLLCHPMNEVLIFDDYVLKTSLRLTDSQIAQLKENRGNIDEILAKASDYMKRNINFITIDEKEYPEKLKSIHSPPAALYVYGSLPDPCKPSVAIVGSRSATYYGKTMTEYIAAELSKTGVQIISGMAAGIDSYAHRGALFGSSKKSFAVLGCGVNICYPKENYQIYSMMGEKGRGGIISEYSPDMPALKRNFPMRNRIISGLSDIVVVSEAREKSGSLITVDFALDQGRDVFAIPGRMNDPLSRGCNCLIAKGAGIVTKPEDILEVLNIKTEGKLSGFTRDINKLMPQERKIVELLANEQMYIETIADKLQISLEKAVSMLLDLELKGYVTQLSCNYYAATVF